MLTSHFLTSKVNRTVKEECCSDRSDKLDIAHSYLEVITRERIHPCLLPLLRLDEASELARLAAPVLHSRTLQPVAQSTMDLSLKCSYQPESGSTRIERVLASGRGAKIITSLDEVLLIQLSFRHDKYHHVASIFVHLRRTSVRLDAKLAQTFWQYFIQPI